MMSAKILEFCDELESKIRSFLAAHPDGGRFDLCNIAYNQELSIPVMIATFSTSEYDVEYDSDAESEWLVFSRPAFDDGFVFSE